MKTYELIGFNNDINLQSINYPLYVYIELTDSCNFNCKFCSINKKNKNFISVELAKKILNQLKDNNIYDVYYTGGEPLLHPNLKEIVEYAEELGMRQTILTNGYLLDKYTDTFDKFVCICVSLHGSEKIHNVLTGNNNYNKLLMNISMAKKYTNVKINCTVTSDNQDIKELKNVLDYASDNNLEVSFSKYNNIGIGKKNNCSIDIEKFVKTLGDLKKDYSFGINDCIATCLLEDRYEYLSHGCGAGYLFASVSYSGDVKICPSSTNILGNIKNKSFNKIWNQKELKNYRKFNWIPTYCKSCKYLSKCRRGCKVELNKKITEFNDYNVDRKKEAMWNKIRNKKMKVNISLIRSEKGKFINLSTPPRKFNKETLKVIELLNEGRKPINLIEDMDLILSLYRDKLIEEER